MEMDSKGQDEVPQQVRCFLKTGVVGRPELFHRFLKENC
jgi:hypothetical protein